MTVTLIALPVAIVLSAFFTLAELAIFRPSELRIRALVDEGVRGSGALAQLRAKPDRLLLFLRLGDASADVAAGALVAIAAYAQWEAIWLALALGAVAVLIVYFGELLPIGLASNHGLRFALEVSPFLLVLTGILGLPLDVLAALSRFGQAGRATRAADGPAGIRPLSSAGVLDEAISESERDLIERAARLDETQVWDIMTPRVDIFAWQDDVLLRTIVPQLGAVRYSRVPVYRGTVDNISGVLYLRDAYQALVSGQRDVPLKALAREPLIVPGSVAVTKLLRDFQARRIHLAIVVDEYGGTDGLVTLEDVLEELVGEIVDETDATEEAIVRVTRNEIIAAGDVELREINHFFNSTFPQLEHRTFNGYVLEELGRVPEQGEKFEREGILIEVLEATETQLARARLRRLSAMPEPGPASGAGRDPDGASDGTTRGRAALADGP